MTPKEYDSILLGLKEYRAEEERVAREALSKSTGQQSVGGGVVRND